MINSQYAVALNLCVFIIIVTMKVLVYGSGAVGLGLTSCLLKSGSEVSCVARPETVRSLKKEGLTRIGIFGRFHAKPDSFTVYQSLDEISGASFDFILVCVKSFDSASSAEDVSKHPGIFNEGTKIVLCQNGWGNAEKFIAYFPEERVYSARVITGFTRRKPNEVEITVHADAIHIGSLFRCELKFVEPLARAITEGGIPALTVGDIEKDLWAKMLYNCALNPLGAILDVPYGVLAEDAYSRDLMNRITDEVFAVMKAAGFKTHWGTSADFLKVFYDRLVPATAEHRSSTLQDIAAGKMTEIEELTGSVLILADHNKINVPYNRAVYAIIKFVEARRNR